MSSIPERLAAATGSLVFHLEDGPVTLRPDELEQRAKAAAGELIRRGVGPGDRVGVLGPNRPEWVVWAHAAWMVGAVLVPLQVPLRVRDAEAFLERIAALLTTARCAVVVADPALLFAIPEDVALAWDTAPRHTGASWTPPSTDDPAVVQFTSGSTAAPRGALLTHGAVLAQVRGLADALIRQDDVVLAWAPFYHDLGLFLLVVSRVLCGVEAHVLPTERFARDPSRWLEMVAEVGATFTIGPQSAWSAAFRGATRRGARLDLSSAEVAMFAAEGIDPAFVDRMQELGEPVGMSPDAIASSYGLAEAVLGVTHSPRGAGLRMHAVDRDLLTRSGRAVERAAGERRVVSAGVPMAGIEIRIAGDGVALRDDTVGEIQVRGESLMSGYVGAVVDDPFVDGWLRTGDLGYMHGGELYVTGRAKDVLIVMGENHYPEDFEWAAGRVEGVRAGRCVAFVDTATERLCLLVEPAASADIAALPRAVKAQVADVVGSFPGDVVVVAAGTIEKTTSGKLRRGHMRSLYEQGRLDAIATVPAGAARA